MSKRNAALDTSFWINTFKVSIARFLNDYFDLFVCQAVIEEVMYPVDVLGLLSDGPALFDTWLQAGRIIRQEPTQAVDWFDRGENYATALALERGYHLLIDDAYAYHFARSRGVSVIATPEFIVWLYQDGRLGYDKARSALKQVQIEKRQRRVGLVALRLLAQRRGEV